MEIEKWRCVQYGKKQHSKQNHIHRIRTLVEPEQETKYECWAIGEQERNGEWYMKLKA